MKTINELQKELAQATDTVNSARADIIILIKQINKIKRGLPAVGERMFLPVEVRQITSVGEVRVVAAYGGGGATIWAKPADLRRELSESAPQPKYEAGKVFRNKSQDKIFRLTGRYIADTDGWHCGTRLYLKNDEHHYKYPEAEILDVKVYEHNNKKYIYDGGPERVPKVGDVYLTYVSIANISRQQVTVCEFNGQTNPDHNNGKRNILIEVKEVD